MGQDFFSHLPSEIIMNILLRLPVRAVMNCKCVCKPLLDMLENHEFVKSHLSKSSVPLLTVFLKGGCSEPYKIFEFVDELNLSSWNVAFNFSLPCNKPPYSSANGLLLLCNLGITFQEIHTGNPTIRDLFICNPFTREYITIPCPNQLSPSSQSHLQMDTYGFGVSKSGQYKLVRIFHELRHQMLVFIELSQPECQVYTVGTGSWRRIGSPGQLVHEGNAVGAFLNGNLHWLTRDMEGSSVWISCFDLETEIFTAFPPPPPCVHEQEDCLNLSVLGDFICLCYNSGGDEGSEDEIVIWLMKEYGDVKSWIKEYVIPKKHRDFVGVAWPIKVFKNGDILMALEVYNKVLHFSSKTQTIEEVDIFGLDSCFCIRAIGYTPSFLPLKTFALENSFNFPSPITSQHINDNRRFRRRGAALYSTAFWKMNSKHEGAKKSRKMREGAKNSKMGQELVAYLPSEIITNILSRLPARTAVSCKSVCKPWLDLLATPAFVKSHLSHLSEAAAPGMALFEWGTHSEPYKIFEFVDELNHNRLRRWNMVFNFNLPCNQALYSSANGLLFLCDRGVASGDIFNWEVKNAVGPRNLFLCNPITRDYITLPCPHSLSSIYPLQMDTYGFGVSKKSGEYKVVRIFHGWVLETPVYKELDRFMCQVYSVGTGSWRRVASDDQPLKYEGNAVGAFLNGNIHWLACDLYDSSIWISCFDLETELFSTFTPPPPCLAYEGKEFLKVSVSALGDFLCLCDNSDDGEMVIWLMKRYGDEKSWTKEYVIRKKKLSGLVCPIKVFKNGDVLMALDVSSRLLYFSNRTQTIRKVDVFGLNSKFCIRAISYSPSLLPLKTFAMESVTSY
ncbi:hypothetical protein C2S51_019651 [Perilla frutescens var. frutescens]|nr:hypothetical protein C2S51_019651 [Perilla frutescens var. frutescens]